MVNIDYITYLGNEEMQAIAYWADYLLPESWLPQTNQTDYNKRTKTLLGRILLFRRLTQMGYTPASMPNMKYTTAGKPYFEKGIFFSFAYRKGIIMVATSRKQAVGIDIEHIRPVSLKAYEGYFEAEAWLQIDKSSHPTKDLIAAWVAKEAANKLEGNIDLPINRNQIKFKQRYLYLDGKKYHHLPIELPSSFMGRLVTTSRCWRMSVNNVTKDFVSCTSSMLYAVRA